ncbi:hypothetical protein [Streptomyces sp. NEAU-W12]|uniref:hypothetical protein n=1 Tax=Streptomyces sp. NEAU-W12 TaxID=2994668 RepID=UPI00224A72B4|nr:hypothetical protein [Streptomyces sp. NEAU-W12]MCX2924279.1 hypothetical protein [Streptomyces sp. NEAU-W12]
MNPRDPGTPGPPPAGRGDRGHRRVRHRGVPRDELADGRVPFGGQGTVVQQPRGPQQRGDVEDGGLRPGRLQPFDGTAERGPGRW